MDVDIQRLTGGRCRVSVLGRGLVSKVIGFAPFAVLSMLDCVPVKADTASLMNVWLSSLEETQPVQFTV